MPSAAADDRRGCELAVEHLVELGHTRIAHLGGPIGISTGRERHEGFVAAMERAGLEVDPALVRFGAAFTEPVGRALCEELLESGGETTAIVAGNDLMALGCYDALAARGMACPEDMSVVGFNDMPFSERFDPPLTTIGIPQYELGAAAADLLLERLHDAEATWSAARPAHLPGPFRLDVATAGRYGADDCCNRLQDDQEEDEWGS